MRFLGAVLWLSALAASFWLGGRGLASEEPKSASGSNSEVVSIASFEAALTQRNPSRRSFETSRFLRKLPAQRIDEVLEIVEAQRFWFEQQDHQLLMAAWVPIDSLAAVDWAFARPSSLKRRASVAVVEALGLYSPSAARSLVTSLDSPELLDILHVHMVQGWARADSTAALTKYLDGLEGDASRRHAIGVLATELSKRGPQALIEWVDGISDDASPGFKQVAFLKSVTALAQTEPRQAARWIDDELDSRFANRAIRTTAEVWAQREPAAAIEWLRTLPEENGQRELVRATFSDWVEIDPAAAESWLRSAPSGPSLDPAIRALVHRDIDDRPMDAMDWVHLISDSPTRLRVLTSAGRAWNRRAPDEFKAWLPDSGLESRIRELILRAPGKRAIKRARAEEKGTRP